MARRDFPAAGDPGALDWMYAQFLRDPHAVPRDLAREFASLLEGYVRSEQDQVAALRRDGHLGAAIDPLQPSQAGQGGPLDDVYSGSIGWEFMHMRDSVRRDWFVSRLESTPWNVDDADRVWALDLLSQAEEFEHGLQLRFPSEKRFGLEGAESYLVLCEAVIRASANNGVRRVVMGGMHRGRLNILAHLMRKPLPSLIAEVMGRPPVPNGLNIAADVPYHNGYSVDRQFGGANVRLSMLPHPSHLSVVAAVALGKSRAAQVEAGRDGERRVLPLLMHTDAAFAGQGIVSEMLQLSGVAAFSVGGAIHLVLDNKVGFTTNPEEGRSTVYATDIARAYDIPVIHVNGEDPEAVLRAAAVAADYRSAFHSDIVVSLHAYRRRGHNELDEPKVTQPLLYQAIGNRDSVVTSYRGQLERRNLVTGAGALASAGYANVVAQAARAAVNFQTNDVNCFREHWAGYHFGTVEEMVALKLTGVEIDTLRALGKALTTIPADFNLDRKVERFIDERRQSIESGEGLTWATAEALAFASLARDGYSVRLGGQDTPRGAFAHRHLVLHDQQSGAQHCVFEPGQKGQVEVFNSPLAEYSVLAFEYGYSLATPRTLVCWEAQFGDFLNIAQPVIDQFISCGEDRWLRSSGVVLMLPHGLDGGGPDHSTAHPERLLNACAGANMVVVNASTPAQYFHLLRRQMLQPFRKPLALLAPKTLLRHRGCVSRLEEFGPGNGFRATIGKSTTDARRVIVCTGKIYYELAEERLKRGLEAAVAIIRIEQLHPLDTDALRKELSAHPSAEFVFCQEEPLNMGPFCVLDRALEDVGGKRFRYIGRPRAASPATGVHSWHDRERTSLLAQAMSGLT